MSNPSPTLPCEVIIDLMVAYESGEASPATRRLVEDHLASCATCRAAFAGDRPITDHLAEEPAPPLTNGRAFVARTRRYIFAGLSTLLLLFALGIGMAMRLVVQQVANQPIPGFPRVDSFWFFFTPLSLVLYLLSLLPPARSRSGSSSRAGWLTPFVRLVLLAALAYGVYQLFAVSSALAASLGVFLLVFALAATFVRLPQLKYATAVTAVVLILLNLVFAGRTVYAIFEATDFHLEQATALGHPSAGADAEDVVTLDLETYGLALQDVHTGTSQPLPLPASGPRPLQAAWAAYSGDGGQAYLTVMEFENAEEARSAFQNWKENVDASLRFASIENTALRAENGSILRFYGPGNETAYSSWQHGNWVTIIEVPGPFRSAMNLARNVKEIVASNYQSAGD